MNLFKSGLSTFGLILSILLYFTADGLTQTYPIGTMSVTYQDASRGNRSIPTDIYYPATSGGSGTPVANGNFPVLVLAHGFSMNNTAYDNFKDELVPRGYILMLPNTETSTIPAPSHGDFGEDISYLANKILAENLDSGSVFYMKVSDKIGVSGHSMGGGSAHLAAASNPNISTLITFAAAETNPSAIAASSNIDVPTLYFTGDNDCVAGWSGNQQGMYNNLASTCKARVDLIGGRHCRFAESFFICTIADIACSPFGFSLGYSEQHQLIFRYMNPWMDYYLKGDCSAWSWISDSMFVDAEVNATLDCNTPMLEAPENLYTSKITPSSARLHWSPVFGADAYKIQGRNIVNQYWVEINVAGGSTDFRDVFGLLNNRTYEWQIKAICNANDSIYSEWSVSDSFMTFCPGPDTLWTSNVTSNSALLNWNNVPGVSAYEIKGRKKGNTNWKNLIQSSLFTNKAVSALDPGTTYEWKVRSWCDTAGIRKSGFTGLDSFMTVSSPTRLAFPATELSGIYIDGRIVLNLDENDSPLIKELLIYDLSGRVVRQFNNPKENIEIENQIYPGMYLLEEIFKDGNRATGKLLVK